jgi:type II secretory pathway pseudopilin PulG
MSPWRSFHRRVHRDRNRAVPCALGRRPRRGKSDGFSILELMVALLVLLVGFMAMMQLIATSVVVNRHSTNLSSLTQLAAEKIEQLRTEALGNPNFGVAGNSNYPSATATSLGSLTADSSVTLPDSSGTNHTVSFFDYVTIDGRNGSITRVAGPDDTGNYISVTRTYDGTTAPPGTPSTSAPTTKTYVRRWTIEGNQPVAGAFRMTVDLSLPSAAGNTSYRPEIRLQAVR